ncbi:uncharacterized protein BX663DRAFT_491785 [Cokeromyces recurvatus]|uniref:uncharacterized protein n=1 Tax=Cokeromyces recurvatus TaxID=90255 RepID=UPI002220C7A7|nr:uncharacterized protein BX663DRAFT_491785 [Cokeromyces recurvatus]KAI7907705.1 hypothetical protein BX663DRAFT_491785 [Cokeromyces recurvatus]
MNTTLYPIFDICPIKHFYMRPYQRINNCTWYPIEIHLTDSTIQPYEMRYQFDDFIVFSRLLHSKFDISKSLLPKIKKSNYAFSFSTLKNGSGCKSQKYIDRQLELENFCHHLLLLPSYITCSEIFLSFFSMKPNEDILQQQDSILETASFKAFSLKDFIYSKQYSEDELEDIFFSRSYIVDHDSSSKSNRSSASSSSTTTDSGDSSSSCSNRDSLLLSKHLSTSTIASLTEENENISTMNFKVIYDSNNIIIIRTSRSISLEQLKSQIIQKFALLHISLSDSLILCSVDGSRSSLLSSHPHVLTSSIMHTFDSSSDSGILISEEEDFTKIMQQKWSSLPKVTLRCVIM